MPIHTYTLPRHYTSSWSHPSATPLGSSGISPAHIISTPSDHAPPCPSSVHVGRGTHITSQDDATSTYGTVTPPPPGFDLHPLLALISTPLAPGPHFHVPPCPQDASTPGDADLENTGHTTSTDDAAGTFSGRVTPPLGFHLQAQANRPLANTSKPLTSAFQHLTMRPGPYSRAPTCSSPQRHIPAMVQTRLTRLRHFLHHIHTSLVSRALHMSMRHPRPTLRPVRASRSCPTSPPCVSAATRRACQLSIASVHLCRARLSHCHITVLALAVPYVYAALHCLSFPHLAPAAVCSIA